jgi:Sulfatase
VKEAPDEIAEIRANYAALVTMCDAYFGKLLDYFDAHGLWNDTCLVLTTDHGFLLGEHDLWAKNLTPYYDELARIPLIIHHPGWTERKGTRTDIVTQTPDLMPTFLEIFGHPVPPEVCAPSIQSRLDAGSDGRVAVFGMFGGPIGAADSRYRYYLYPPDLDDESLCEYTLMPTHLKGFFSPEEMRTAEWHPPLSFTKGMPLMRTRALISAKRPPGGNRDVFRSFGTALYAIDTDPEQSTAIDDPEVACRLQTAISAELSRHDATPDFFAWMGLPAPEGAGAMQTGRNL